MYHFLDPQNSDGDDDDEGRTTGDVSGSKLSNSSRFLIRDHRESVIINNNNSTKSNQPAPSKWYCVECQRSFAAQFALDQHRRFKHQGYKIHCRYCQHMATAIFIRKFQVFQLKFGKMGIFASYKIHCRYCQHNKFKFSNFVKFELNNLEFLLFGVFPLKNFKLQMYKIHCRCCQHTTTI
uniref:C2H2-type domain-containing protein n=1 Tax=Romanomermis culicivorax TaxID=13658 RepID=A0A915IM83_ROMCU